MYLKVKRNGKIFWILLNRFIVGSVTGYCVSETVLCLWQNKHMTVWQYK